MGAVLERLCGKRFLLVTGKGGVGKTTLSAASALAITRRGRRVALLEADPRESLCHLLDVPPSGGEMTEVEDGLFLQNLEPRRALDAFVHDHLHLGFLARRVTESTVYEHFVEGAPGLRELAVLDHVQRSVCGDIDLVVLDAPATGHGLALLDAPRLVAEVIREGPFGRMAESLAGLVDDPERCGVLVAALAEEMPVQEAIELIGALEQRLGRGPDLVLVNRLYPEAPAGAKAASGDRMQELWLRRRAVNDRELRRLARAWAGPQVELPMLPLARGPELVAALAARLEQAC